MNDLIINSPELAMRATVEKGFIAFYDRKGKCLGRRDTDYVEAELVKTVLQSARGVGVWVQSLYLQLIWKPLARLSEMNLSVA